MVERWRPGERIVRREVLGLDPAFRPEPEPRWCTRPWMGVPVRVVEDSDEHLVSYISEGAELGFAEGEWPTSDGLHPWSVRTAWEGHGCLMVQRPGDPYAIWHLWLGPDREFLCWYLNLQAPFVRTRVGYDTQDYELDLVVFPDGNWIVKDLEDLDDRVAEGRFTAGLADWVRRLGDDLGEQLDAGRRWWDPKWASWEPPEWWRDDRLPDGWAN